MVPRLRSRALRDNVTCHVRLDACASLLVAVPKSRGEAVPAAALPGCVHPDCPIPQDLSSLRGQIIPERRFVEAINRQAYQYEMGDFPIEWEAWIRKKRNDPPTLEEILKNENYREEMKQKIKEVAEKDKLLQASEYKEGLVAEPVHTRVKGHASAPYYGKKEPSQDPTSTASTFQPGSWMPPGSGSSHNK
ncbi:PREDICTED: mimitin, mitochondrial [Tauraco erythrolophus]|nr:PREDICTED: mimitin, mitochondrial [Tauraco erythrolophus]